MTRKTKFICVIVSLLMVSGTVFSKNFSEETVELLTSVGSDRSEFSDGAVDSASLDKILKCGINAPSGRNRQPWHFSVIKDTETIEKLVSGANKGNVLIIVSGDSKSSINLDFDCALATENMFIAAKSLNLAARIYTGPISKVKADNPAFKIPKSFQPISILRIGKLADGNDATTAASSKKSFSKIVTQ